MTEPKFRIGDVVRAPDVIGDPRFQVQGICWDTEWLTWLYFGPTSHSGSTFCQVESALVSYRESTAIAEALAAQTHQEKLGDA